MKVLTGENLRDLADSGSYRRGEEYFRERRVASLTEHQGEIIATVHGTRNYRVNLRGEDGELYASCTCPVGESGEFCKHCVAVGLTWLEKRRAGTESAPETPGSRTTLDDVETYLSRLPQKELVSMLMEQTREDERLRNRLLLKVARRRDGKVDVESYFAAIENAFSASDYVPYQEMWEYTREIEDVIDNIEELLEEGHAAEAMKISDRVISLAGENAGSFDDSDGYMGGIMDHLQDIHLRACEEARPDPGELARKLFQWEMTSDWDVSDDAERRYDAVLGERGRTVYRELARKEWEKIPVLQPGMKNTEFYGGRYRITSIMESIARQTGNLEDIVAVKTRNLSDSFQFLRIAELYRDAGQFDKALEWAEKGINAFPAQRDFHLNTFLAEEYRRVGRHDEEMELIWKNFTGQPSLRTYQDIHAHAKPLGIWETWREQALRFLRKKSAKKRGVNERVRGSWGGLGDNSLLVEIFLWEGDSESAWNEARAGGCSRQLWLTLAGKRAEAHPEDAVAVYRMYVEDTVQLRNNNAYAEAVEYIRKIRDLMRRMGKGDEFLRYLAELRIAHKPKRNFMKLLNEEKWE